MRHFVIALAAACLCVSGAEAAKPSRASHAAPDFAAAVAAPGRPEDQIKLDASRRPAEVLAFEGLRRGDMVLDLFAGGGYYTEIMARAVGPAGGVLAWNPAPMVNAKSRAAFAELKRRAPNTGLLATPATALSLPTATFDFAMIHLNYHDTYWESAKYGFVRMEPDAMLRTLYQSMKPGGTVAVIDHVANPGGDTRETADKYHRIDPATVRADFQRAGFVMDGESNLLRNPADKHDLEVFEPAIRGHTDRIVYRFKKPRR